MTDGIHAELKNQQFVSTLAYDFTTTVSLNQNGRQFIDLDEIGSDIEINIGSISNLEGGQLELSIIGSDTYNVSFSTSFQTLVANTSLTLPVFVNESGSRNNLLIVWNDPEEVLSTRVDERLIGLTNIVTKSYTTPVSPTLTSLTVEATDVNSIISVFSEAVNGDLSDWGISSDGDPISLTTINSGVGTDTFDIALSRDVVAGETLIVTVGTSNTIVGVTSGAILDTSIIPTVSNNVASYIMWQSLIQASQTEADLITTGSSGAGGAAVLSSPITKSAGCGVEITITDTTTHNNATICLTSLSNSELFGDTTTFEHGAYQNNTNLASILNDSINQFDNGVVANGSIISLELADDGGGGFNVLYKVDGTTYRTESLQITGDIYVHAKIQGDRKIMANATLL